MNFSLGNIWKISSTLIEKQQMMSKYFPNIVVEYS